MMMLLVDVMKMVLDMMGPKVKNGRINKILLIHLGLYIEHSSGAELVDTMQVMSS